MERKEFLAALGVSAGSFVIASCLGACGKGDTGSPDPGPGPGPTPGTKVDFNFDVAANADISSKGWTIMNGIIIAKSGSSYLALSGACTHEGNPMTYDSAANKFPCSLKDGAHGSVFDANGVKLQGPATSNLKKFNTTLSGNSLRVYES